MASPTQRSLAHCKKEGWPYSIQERWNHYAKIRQDLWGCIDLLVLDGLPGVMGIQATSGTNHAARVAKIRALMSDDDATGRALRAFLSAGNRLEVWSWGKRGERGKRKLWVLRREPIHGHTERALGAAG